MTAEKRLGTPHREAVPANDADGASLDAALHELRAVVWRPANEPANAARLQRVLHAVCASARAAELPPERLLVRVKQTLESVPAVTEAEVYRRADVNARIVTTTINTFFQSE